MGMWGGGGSGGCGVVVWGLWGLRRGDGGGGVLVLVGVQIESIVFCWHTYFL